MRKIDDAVYRDLAARACVGALFVLLSWNFLSDFIRTGRITACCSWSAKRWSSS
jgi:hypothetical protein